MSTAGKLDVLTKLRRKARLALLRNPPRKKDYAAMIILAELALIHDNPRLSGDTKHELFMRGAKQLSELK